MPFDGSFAAFFGVYFVWLAVSVLVFPFVLIYFVEVRNARLAGSRDPRLGTKVWLTFLMSLMFQIAVAGATMMAVLASDYPDVARAWEENRGGERPPSPIFRGDDREEAWKVAWGLVLGAAAAAILPTFLYARWVRPAGGVDVLRKAVGINGALAGLVHSVAVVVAVVALFLDGSARMPTAIAIVHGVVLVVCGVWVIRALDRAQDAAAAGTAWEPVESSG